MTEFYARKDYIYDGGDRIFSIPFDYLELRHIRVIINETLNASFQKLNESQIQISDWIELNIGDIVSIRRITPINEQMVIFSDKSILNEDTQNLSQKQMFNAVQELYDSNIKFEEDITSKVDTNKQELTNLVIEKTDELANNMKEADNNLQLQLNVFKDTVNLTAERINLIEDYVISTAQSAESATQSAEKAQEFSMSANNSSLVASNKLEELKTLSTQTQSDISTAKENALEEIKISKNQALAEIVQASLPATDALSNYYTKYEINTFMEDVCSKADINNSLNNIYTKAEIDTRLGDVSSLLDLINGEVI